MQFLGLPLQNQYMVFVKVLEFSPLVQSKLTFSSGQYLDYKLYLQFYFIFSTKFSYICQNLNHFLYITIFNFLFSACYPIVDLLPIISYFSPFSLSDNLMRLHQMILLHKHKVIIYLFDIFYTIFKVHTNKCYF